MANDGHLDGNVMGGLLMEVFGEEMTDALGCCAQRVIEQMRIACGRAWLCVPKQRPDDGQ